MKRRWVALLLLLAIGLVVCFIGCGNVQDNTPLSTWNEDTESSSSIVDNSGVRIYNVDPVAEEITIINEGDYTAKISGWYITDGEGEYEFPSPSTILPCETLMVDMDDYNPTRYTRGLYLNNQHDEVKLYNNMGKLVDYVEW